MTALAPHLTAFLREHLPRERAVSPHTVKTYANCFVLLVRFASDRLKRRPTDLEIEDFGTDMIMAFLGHVEVERGSCVRTRNGRLAAIRSFFRYIEYRVPACLDQALRVRSIPSKKANKTLIDYLDRAEIKALLDAPDPRTRLGTRDRAMLHLTYAAGLRVSELVSLQLRDFPDRSLSTVHIMGKGRRERVLPLWKETQSALRAWLVIRPETEVAEVFLNANGQPITRDGFAFRLAKHVNAAAKKQPSLLRKRVTPPRSRSAISSPSCAVIMAEEKIWARPSRLAGSISLRSSEAFWRQPQRARAPLPADGSRSVSCAQTAAAFAISQASIGGVENCWSSTCASLRTCRGGKAASIQSNRASASCTFVARSIRDDSRSQSSAPISTALL